MLVATVGVWKKWNLRFGKVWKKYGIFFSVVAADPVIGNRGRLTPGNPALLMPFVTRGRSAASAVGSGSPRSRWRFRTAARYTRTVPGFTRPAMCAAKALNIKSEAGRGSHLQTAQKPR